MCKVGVKMDLNVIYGKERLINSYFKKKYNLDETTLRRMNDEIRRVEERISTRER